MCPRWDGLGWAIFRLSRDNPLFSANVCFGGAAAMMAIESFKSMWRTIFTLFSFVANADVDSLLRFPVFRYSLNLWTDDLVNPINPWKMLFPKMIRTKTIVKCSAPPWRMLFPKMIWTKTIVKCSAPFNVQNAMNDKMRLEIRDLFDATLIGEFHLTFCFGVSDWCSVDIRFGNNHFSRGWAKPTPAAVRPCFATRISLSVLFWRCQLMLNTYPCWEPFDSTGMGRFIAYCVLGWVCVGTYYGRDVL